jgi:hypothetical protein
MIAPQSHMKRINGIALVVIGVLHSMAGLAAPGLLGFGGIWKEIIDAGVVDVVKADSLRIWGYYWFLLPGFFMILFGALCHWIENRLRRSLPRFAGWMLLVIAGFGILLDVDTGFWLVLGVAINMIVSSRGVEESGVEPLPSHQKSSRQP